MRARFLSIMLFAAACGGGDDANNGGADSGPGGDSGGGGGDATNNCDRSPAAADRTRHVVIAHPYDMNAASAPTFEVLQLTADGELSRFEPPHMFDLGFRMPFGNIVFTPDGSIGIATLDNGKLGVFRLDAEGNATVINPAFTGGFYAQSVVMDPAGDRIWVIDGDTRENGGGIYDVSLACDGSLTDNGLVAAARSPGGMGFVGSKAVLAARDVLDSPTSVDDVQIVDLSSSTATYVGGGDAFGDDNGTFSGFAISSDGKTAFVGDSNFAGNNRVGVVSIGQTSITKLGVIGSITDPSSISASPFSEVAIVSSSQPPNEGIYILDKNGPNDSWRKASELTYSGPNSQLPGDEVMITQGQLEGLVLVSELSNIRKVRFHADGSVTDDGSLTYGDAYTDILGAIGIQP